MGYSDKEEDLEGIFDRWEEVSSATGTISEEAPDIEQVKSMRADKSDCFFGPNVIRMCQAGGYCIYGPSWRKRGKRKNTGGF